MSEGGRTRILAFNDHYLPGYKAGGSVRSLANMVERLSDALRFFVVSADRDIGDTEPYPVAHAGEWVRVGRGLVRYQPPGRRVAVGELVRQSGAEVLYLNSFFSPRSGLRPLAFAAGGRRRVAVVLAPRGEFSPGAIALKGWKKRPYARLIRASGLARNVLWHASGPGEADDIRRWFPAARIHIAPDLAGPVPPPHPPAPKRPGELRIAFVSRIDAKKNLAGAIRLLAGLRGEVTLTIFGPVHDADYWASCRRSIDALPPGIRVVHAGAVPHEALHDALAGQHVFLLPTLGENFGHVVLEALLAGLPVVLSDRTPWRGLAAAGVGHDLPLDDTAGFHAALQGYVDLDGPALAAAAARARRYGEEASAAPDVIERNLRLFAEAAAAARGGSGTGRRAAG